VLRVTAFEISVDPAGPRVEASFDAASLRVAQAMRDGRVLAPGALSASDVRKIEATIVDDVLRARAFPLVHFSSTSAVPRADGYDVVGSLTLAGVAGEVAFPVRSDGGQLRMQVEIDQTRFGIRPYSGAFGTIRVKRAVVLRAVTPPA
jgi:polyisoprenoid-binding protein YceI